MREEQNCSTDLQLSDLPFHITGARDTSFAAMPIASFFVSSMATILIQLPLEH